MRSILAANLRLLMSDRGWSQPDLARRSGVAQTSISKILRCGAAANLDTLAKLAAAFSVQPCTLLMSITDPAMIPDLEQLRASYLCLSAEGRKFVNMVTKREAETSSPE